MRCSLLLGLYVQILNNYWCLLVIPITAWSRIYFGCHYIGDCLMGTIIGCSVSTLILFNLPIEPFYVPQYAIHNWLNSF